MRRVVIAVSVLIAGCGCGFALNPALDISHYAHNTWTVRAGFSVGAIFAPQTPDGYLWLGSEFGLFSLRRRSQVSRGNPRAGQRLPANPYSLLAMQLA
jgi:hypothetical protein